MESSNKRHKREEEDWEMKLKTLKDLQEESYDNDAVVDKLKAEAIKWVKDSEKKKKEGIRPLLRSIDWAKHFFNITEDDLK